MARKKKKHERRKARESVVALLYSSDITELDTTNIVDAGLYPGDDLDVSEYAEVLLRGIAEHVEEIDARLMSTSENWALDRMPIVDRAILRLAVYEMLFVADVPVSVAINEAVELAKVYGGEDESSRFVNGVLGKIARIIEADESDAVENAADVEEAGNGDGAVEPALDGVSDGAAVHDAIAEGGHE